MSKVNFKVRIFRLKDTEDTFLKANLSIYDNSTLIVTGTSYYLWTMDNFKFILFSFKNPIEYRKSLLRFRKYGMRLTR